MTTPRRARGDGGQLGGVEVLPFAVLVFVVGTLLVANAWGVVDAKFAVTSAAREAARSFVEAPDAASAAGDARRAALLAVEGHGRDPARADVELVGGAFRRCAPVTVEVSYRVHVVELPFIGGFGDGIVVRARHREVVDPYRRRLPGTAVCD